MTTTDTGKKFRNVNTNELYVIERVEQKHVNSFTDIRNIYVIRNELTGSISRWENKLFRKYFTLSD